MAGGSRSAISPAATVPMRRWQSPTPPTRWWTASAHGASTTTSTHGTPRPATARERLSPAVDDWEAVDGLAALGEGAAGRTTRTRCSVSARRPPFAAASMQTAASIQPARLARGLRRVLLERGVTIHEGTRVAPCVPAAASRSRPRRSRDRGPGHPRVQRVGSGWPGFRSRVLTWGSYMVITEPIPDRLEALGWTGGELISDSRFTISYSAPRRTGGSHSAPAWARRATAAGSAGVSLPTEGGGPRRCQLPPSVPDARRRAAGDAWGGPIDISGHRFVEIGQPTVATCTSPMASPATARGHRGSRAASWPSSRRARAGRRPGLRSSGAASHCCRPSRSGTSAHAWSAMRSSGMTMRSTPAEPAWLLAVARSRACSATVGH